MGTYTGNPAAGVVLTSTIPSDASKLMAADVNVPLELLLDNAAALAALKAPSASPTFTGVVSLPGAPLLPAYANDGAVVAMGAFVMTKSGTLNHSVPNGGIYYTEPNIWAAPARPYLLEGAIIEITGSCTSSASPGGVVLELVLGGLATLVEGTMDAFVGGTTYTVDGTTTKKTIFGIALAERGTWFTAPPASSGTDALRATASALGIAALTGSPLQGATVTLRVTQSGAAARTLMIPYKITIYGRLL